MADLPLEARIAGIKCDACDWKDMTVNVKDYKQWLNRPCPKCGANLLTQDDYDVVQMLLDMQKKVNAAFPAPKEGEPRMKGTIKLNGTGLAGMKVQVEMLPEPVKVIKFVDPFGKLIHVNASVIGSFKLTEKFVQYAAKWAYRGVCRDAVDASSVKVFDKGKEVNGLVSLIQRYKATGGKN